MGIPQMIYVALMLFSIYVNFTHHGMPREPFDFNTACMGSLLSLGLLYWGGFFSG